MCLWLSNQRQLDCDAMRERDRKRAGGAELTITKVEQMSVGASVMFSNSITHSRVWFLESQSQSQSRSHSGLGLGCVAWAEITVQYCHQESPASPKQCSVVQHAPQSDRRARRPPSPKAVVVRQAASQPSSEPTRASIWVKQAVLTWLRFYLHSLD